MNIYTHTKFTGHYPVGVAALVKARDRKHAITLLNDELKRRSLPGDAELDDLVEVDAKFGVLILCNGNY